MLSCLEEKKTKNCSFLSCFRKISFSDTDPAKSGTFWSETDPEKRTGGDPDTSTSRLE